MTEITEREFSDLIVSKLMEINNNVVLENPREDATFPLRVVGTPVRVINKLDGAKPIDCLFSIRVENWCNSKRDCMDMMNATDLKLRTLNLIRVNNSLDMYDDVTRKYRLGGDYEVTYNGLINCFEIRR